MEIIKNISSIEPSLPLLGTIVSLVPSQTELLFELGLAERVVGVTKYCIYPALATQKTRVGGTKRVDFGIIEQLNPAFILGNKEENEIGFMTQLAQKYPVFVSDIFTLDDALTMIREVGALTGSPEKATEIAATIAKNFDKMMRNPPKKPRRVAYLIWRKPYMVAAAATFIDAMLGEIGFENAFANGVRYPVVSAADLIAAQPDCIFLSSEPFPFRQKHIEELQQICPTAKIRLVDGEFFSWYGSRLQAAPSYFETILQDLNA